MDHKNKPVSKPSLDAGDFTQLHVQHRDRLVRSINGLVRDRERAEDVASRAFETAWEKREKFRGDASPSTWVQAIARNQAWEAQNQERIGRIDSLDGGDVLELASAECVADDVEKRDERAQLQKALARLPARCRRALSAHFLDGYSVREIANREGVPLGTVLSRIHTGKQMLRVLMQQPFEAQPGETASQAHTRESPEPSQPESISWSR